MQSQPLITVYNVEPSSRWYQKLLGCTSGHGGKKYERIMFEDKIILQIHAWHAEGMEHPFLGNPEIKPNGNGVVIWFQVDDFEDAVKRAREMNAEILEEPHHNPNAHHMEMWLRDLDGYVVVIACKQQ